MSSLTQFGSGAIKSIQRGTIGFGYNVWSATATISSVNTSKTELRYLGNSGSQYSAGIGGAQIRIVLQDSTTVYAVRDENSGYGAVSWELTEYY